LFETLPEKIEISRKFAWKMELLLTQIHDPRISNPIDATVIYITCIPLSHPNITVHYHYNIK